MNLLALSVVALTDNTLPGGKVHNNSVKKAVKIKFIFLNATSLKKKILGWVNLGYEKLSYAFLGCSETCLASQYMTVATLSHLSAPL